MTEDGGYVNYLPPVLWGDETARIDLEGFLRAFEMVLTGRTGPAGGADDDKSIAATIAQIPELFDPWRAPTDFLPWLASWVALEFPTLDVPLWDEFQQRNAMSRIAAIHRLRGLRQGLNQAMELFAVTGTRLRVSVDDGDKLLVTTPRVGATSPVTGLISQGPVVQLPLSPDSPVLQPGLVRPQCIAASPSGDILIGDFGAALHVTRLPSRMWRVDATGALVAAAIPPAAAPPPSDPHAFNNVVAAAVSPAQPGRKETLYLIDEKDLLSAPTPYTESPATLVTTLTDAVLVRAMAVDVNGDILVLDRGNDPRDAAQPRVLIVRPGPPPTVQIHPLGNVVDPLALLVIEDGTLLVGDGGDPNGLVSGNLVQIDRSDPTVWKGTPLLGAVPVDKRANADTALVSPAAIAADADGTIFVLDTGLRPFGTEELVVTIARPASVFRVDRGKGTSSVSRVTQNGNLVAPTGMVAVDGRLVICDPGQLESEQQFPVLSRLAPFRFCVIVHFEDATLPADEQLRKRAFGQVANAMRVIIDEFRPAHTHGTLIIAG